MKLVKRQDSSRQAGWVMLACMLLVLLMAWPLMSLMQQVYLQTALQSQLQQELQAKLYAEPLTSVIKAAQVAEGE
jgi:hypothetical protein